MVTVQFTQATSYAASREVFGRKIGANQGVQFPLAKAYAAMEAAALMVQRAAAIFDKHRPCGPEANMAKYLGTHPPECCLGDASAQSDAAPRKSRNGTSLQLQRRRGWPAKRACRLLAGTPLPKITTSSGNGARRGCIRYFALRAKLWRRHEGTYYGLSCWVSSGDKIAPISTNMILAYLSEHVLGLPKSY